MKESADYSYRLELSFPGANTPICDTELEELKKHQLFLMEAGVEVVIRTPDEEEVILRWLHKNGLSSFMACQLQHTPNFRESAIWIIGTVSYTIYNSIQLYTIGRNIDEIIRVLEAHMTGEPCQATWQPGDKTLKDKFK